MKSKPYWQNLRDDIESAGTITDPLLVTKNRVILAGHSRTEIARSLRDSGDSRFEEVPVRFILSPLRDEDLKRRVCLSNLNRFEIDVDTRVILRAEIYPEYYAEVEHTAGRPRKLTEASEQDSGRSITPKQIAEMNATTMRTIQKERELYQTAKKIAADNNRDQPAVEDVKAARKSKNRTRRSSSTSISSHVKKLIRDALAQYEQTETNQANRDAVRSFVVSVLGDE